MYICKNIGIGKKAYVRVLFPMFQYCTPNGIVSLLLQIMTFAPLQVLKCQGSYRYMLLTVPLACLIGVMDKINGYFEDKFSNGQK